MVMRNVSKPMKTIFLKVNLVTKRAKEKIFKFYTGKNELDSSAISSVLLH